MRNAIAPILAAFALAFAAPRTAHACGQGGGGYGAFEAIAIGGLAVATVDAGLLLWDGGSALASHQPSRGYGVFELVWTAPQVVLGGALTLSYLNNTYNRSGAVASGLYTAAMTIASAHAIWTIAREPAFEGPDEEARVHQPSATVALSPTYVPLGQKALPGLGLTGRF
jgi:hypothetical protein